MKPIHLLLILLCLRLPLSAQSLSPEPRMVGLEFLPGSKRAIVELKDQTFFLEEGQRGVNRGVDIEIMHIHEANGTADVKLSETSELTLSLRAPEKVPASGLTFESIKLHNLLTVHAELSKRSVLRYPSLSSASRFSFVVSATTPTEAAKAIEKQLTEAGITFIPDGESFVIAVPRSDASKVKPHAPPHPKSDSSSQGTEMIAPGMIDFREVDPIQVTQLYAEWVGRKLDRSQKISFVGDRIVFKSVNSLTRAEAVYALETLLLWQGVKFVPEGNDMIKPVPVSE